MKTETKEIAAFVEHRIAYHRSLADRWAALYRLLSLGEAADSPETSVGPTLPEETRDEPRRGLV